MNKTKLVYAILDQIPHHGNYTVKTKHLFKNSSHTYITVMTPVMYMVQQKIKKHIKPLKIDLSALTDPVILKFKHVKKIRDVPARTLNYISGIKHLVGNMPLKYEAEVLNKYDNLLLSKYGTKSLLSNHARKLAGHAIGKMFGHIFEVVPKKDHFEGYDINSSEKLTIKISTPTSRLLHHQIEKHNGYYYSISRNFTDDYLNPDAAPIYYVKNTSDNVIKFNGGKCTGTKTVTLVSSFKNFRSLPKILNKFDVELRKEKVEASNV